MPISKFTILTLPMGAALVPLISVLLVSIGITSGFAQGDEDLFEIIEVTDLDTHVGESYMFYGRALSPDGQMIAWLDTVVEGLCLYSFTVDEVSCYEAEWSENFLYWANLARLNWSPDSQYIAVSQDPFLPTPPIDTDIWLFELGTGIFGNLTEDQFDGSVWEFVPNGTPKTSDVPVDFLSFWAPGVNTLYFLRTHVTPQAEIDKFEELQLYQLSPSRPEPELVFDFGSQFQVYNIQVAFPPDSDSIVIYLLTAGDSGDSPSKDLWIFDLASESLRHLVSVDEFLIGMPEGITQIHVPREAMMPLPGSSSGIIFSANGRDDSMPRSVRNFFYVDLQSGAITPLLNVANQGNSDFNGIQDRYRPIVAIPQRNANNLLLMYAEEPWGEYYISSISLPPSEVSMSDSYSVEADFHPPLDTPLFSMSANGRVIVGTSLVDLK